MAQTTQDNQPDESAIDRARNKETTQKKEINWSGLGKDVLNFLLKLIIIFLIGSRVVFACKVAQANILPTDLDCMPYTPATNNDEDSPKYESTTPEANIDVSYVYNADQEGYKTYATKIAFEINEFSKKNYLIDKLRTIEYNPKVDPMVKYLCVVLQSLFVFYYGITNSLFNFMNSNLNESFIILLGPYLLKYLSVFIYPVSIVVSIIFCLLNIGWLLKSNKNNDKEYKHKSTTEPVWRSCDPLSSIYNFCGTIIYLYVGFFLASALSLSPIPALISFMCLLSPLFMKAKIVEKDNETGEKKDMKDNPIYGFRSSINGLIESKMDVFMFIFCIFTTYATYTNSTDVKAPIFVGLASIWFLYRMIKHKEPPAMSTPDLASYERNEKVCPEKKLSKAELDAMARDEEEDAEKNKEAKKNSFISQIIAFWIGVWTWLPKTIYSLWLKLYDSLFGPDKPCPAGGDAETESQPEQEPAPEPQPQSESQPESLPQPEPTSVEIPTPVPKQIPLNEPQTSPVEQPVASETTAPETQEQPKTALNGGGRRKDELLRKIKNLTRSLKRRP
jgi:hypothetical protein